MGNKYGIYFHIPLYSIAPLPLIRNCFDANSLTLFFAAKVTKDGNSIPIVPVIGNHETGGTYDFAPSLYQIPFYFRYLMPFPADPKQKDHPSASVKETGTYGGKKLKTLEASVFEIVSY